MVVAVSVYRGHCVSIWFVLRLLYSPSTKHWQELVSFHVSFVVKLVS